MNTADASRDKDVDIDGARDVHRRRHSRSSHLPSRQNRRHIPPRHFGLSLLTAQVGQPLELGVVKSDMDFAVEKGNRGRGARGGAENRLERLGSRQVGRMWHACEISEILQLTSPGAHLTVGDDGALEGNDRRPALKRMFDLLGHDESAILYA